MTLRHLLPVLALGAALLQPGPAAANLERAQAAQARGDLRAAQIELRNAVRSRPDDPALRAALAEASLELGDGDTAEKEARAALERGYDQAAGTRLLLRAYLTLDRTRELLRDFPSREAPGDVAGQIAAARALAQLATGDRAGARQSAADAVRLAPDTPDPHLAAAAVARADGDAVGSEAALDRALIADPFNPAALLRKAATLFGRGDAAAAVTTLDPLVARSPGQVPARILRAEALLRLNRDAEARGELEAALRTQPANAPAIYLLALVQSRAGNWAAANEAFLRLSPLLGNFPEGFLHAALARRAVEQREQAFDLAQRHVARRPEDPRGVKLLATMELEAGRPAEAAVALSRLAERGVSDAEAFELLARAYTATGRLRDAAAALERAAQLQPANGAVMARLAAARLAAGDIAGSTRAAEVSLASSPQQAGAREALAAAALARGDLAAAEAELNQLPPDAQRGEAAAVLAGTIRLGRLDFAGARRAFEEALQSAPASVPARLGLARVMAGQGDLATMERLFTEVLERQPNNTEALSRLEAMAGPNSPRAATARAALEQVHAANPAAPGPVRALVGVLVARNETANAVQLLETEEMRRPGVGGGIAPLRARLYARLQRWSDAEAAARLAVAENPADAAARVLLSQVLFRSNNPREAEAILRDGLRQQPADELLQQSLVSLTLEAQGIDAALSVTDQLARLAPPAAPGARFLRGDLLLAQGRPADAAQAFTTVYDASPSSAAALRLARALHVAGRQAQASAALNAWLQRSPDDVAALDQLAQFDLLAGRAAEAEQRFEAVVARQPGNAAALNNLAWLLGEQPAKRARGRELAERAFFLQPNAETADTLGWILARQGDLGRAVPVLRQAAAMTSFAATPNRGIVYRFAAALGRAGQRDEARRILEGLLANDAAFPERAEAQRLLAEVAAGR